MLGGKRVGVGLTRSARSRLLPSLFPVKGAGPLRPRGGDPCSFLLDGQPYR